MFSTKRSLVSPVVAVIAAFAMAIVFSSPAFARGGGRGGGGGGFRGGGGGGGFRAGGGGGFSRPSAGARPSMPSYRPSPQPMPGRPGQGGMGPGNRPGQPGYGPGQPGNRPPYHTGNNNINTGNINVNSNNGGWGWGWGSGAGLAIGAAAATGAAVGSATSSDNYYAPTTVYSSTPAPVYTLPSGCSTEVVNGTPYQNCNGSYYQPVYQGSSVVYQPVPAPY